MLTPETTNCKRFLEILSELYSGNLWEPAIHSVSTLCQILFQALKGAANMEFKLWMGKQANSYYAFYMSYSQCKGMKTWPLPWKTFNLVAIQRSKQKFATPEDSGSSRRNIIAEDHWRMLHQHFWKEIQMVNKHEKLPQCPSVSIREMQIKATVRLLSHSR